jgi:ubiquinone/menaquinone biosynthesis C-methylase UbiE
MCVLDVGGGLGGPARTLAVEFGCSVTVVDLAESFIRASTMITGLLALESKVTHLVADALDLPFVGGSFDVVWTQNSGMNIADKETLHAGFHRLLRPGGRLVTQEPMAGPVQPLVFPVMWAEDATTSYLRTPEDMQSTIEGAGFRLRSWEVTKPVKASEAAGRREPQQRIQSMLMGDEIAAISAAGRRNNAEGRVVTVQAVFDRQ